MENTCPQDKISMPMANHAWNHTPSALEEDLLHPNNILLHHDLLLITRYHNTTSEQKTTQTYVDYLNHTQTKDRKYVPPL
jgi:hypothetical protein